MESQSQSQSIYSQKSQIKDQISDPDQLYVNITIGKNTGALFVWPYNIKIPQHIPIDSILDIEEAFVYVNDSINTHPSFIYLLIKEAKQYSNQQAQTTQIVCVFKPVQQFTFEASGKSTLYEMPNGFKKKYVQLDSKNEFNFILATYDINTNEFVKLQLAFECNLTFTIL